KIEGNGFRVINLFRVMAHSPKVGMYFLRLGNSILFKGAVPTNLRELAILRVGQINQAHYEYSQHVPIALRMGVRQEQIDALTDWETSRHFNEQERAVLRYTDEVTKNIRVKDDTFAAVRKFLNEEGMVELTTNIGYYGMVCRILEAFQIELDEGVPKKG
ncbi:MAG TPA: carboxymuconolactone decarboxylase family protein, partial [Syntrophales bacterium]